MTNTHKTILILLLSVLIYMSSCSKTASTPASIVGTWSQTSQRNELLINNVIKYDTTLQITGNIFSFSADGYYTSFTSSGTIGSAYVLNGNTLSLFDTTNGKDKWVSLNVNTLNAHNLAIQEDLFASGDTIGRYIVSFTR